jgi:hypothetical protein
MTASPGTTRRRVSLDVRLSGSGDLAPVAVQRGTSAPLPPLTQCGGVFFGDYTRLTAVDNAHRLWMGMGMGMGMDTRDLELFYCSGTATPTTPPAVCTGTAPNGSTANDQDIVTAAQSAPSK